MHACVETGAAGAAASLTRELPFLSQPLAQAHADIGNHRAARRVAITTGVAVEVGGFLEEDLTAFLDLEALSDVLEERLNAKNEDRCVSQDDSLLGEHVSRMLFGGEANAPPPPLSQLLGPRRTLLVDTMETLLRARTWLEEATSIDNGIGGGHETTKDTGDVYDDDEQILPTLSQATTSSTSTHSLSHSVIGLDCEWQPGKSLDGGKIPNPVALVGS